MGVATLPSWVFLFGFPFSTALTFAFPREASPNDLDPEVDESREERFLSSSSRAQGLESIVFLVGVVSDLKDLSSLPLPLISALVLSRLVGCCFFQGEAASERG